MTISIKHGTITTYSEGTARGQVQWDGQTQSFSVGSFHGGRPTRPPRTGDTVEVVVSDGQSREETMLFIRLPRK